MHSAALACEREEQAASVDIEFQDEKSKQDICNDSDVREQITEGSFCGRMQDENITLR